MSFDDIGWAKRAACHYSQQVHLLEDGFRHPSIDVDAFASTFYFNLL